MGTLSNLLAQYQPAPPTPLAAFGSNARLPSLLGGYGVPALPGSPLPTQPTGWDYCALRFRRFLANIEPTPNQHEDVQTKVAGIIDCLNRKFWGGPLAAGLTSRVIAGSWAKGTRARPSSDMDIIFLLPWAMYHRYANRLGNKQSGILQEVKAALQLSYRDTVIQCDGPTVIMKFSSYKVEIAPAFLEFTSPAEIDHPDFRVMLCDTNQGGRYKRAAPAAERQKIIRHNEIWNGDLIALIRMAKTWKRCCSVPIKPFLLEQLGIEFLQQWPFVGKGVFWYDFMIRDFLAFIPSRKNGYNVLPMSNELFFYGDAWVSKAEKAYKIANLACAYEQYNLNALAGEEWQKIFGYEIPKEA